jgi:hypothetical protein
VKNIKEPGLKTQNSTCYLLSSSFFLFVSVNLHPSQQSLLCFHNVPCILICMILVSSALESASFQQVSVGFKAPGLVQAPTVDALKDGAHYRRLVKGARWHCGGIQGKRTGNLMCGLLCCLLCCIPGERLTCICTAGTSADAL